MFVLPNYTLLYITIVNILLLNKNTTSFVAINKITSKNIPLKRNTELLWMTARSDGWYPSQEFNFKNQKIIYDELYFANSNDLVLCKYERHTLKEFN